MTNIFQGWLLLILRHCGGVKTVIRIVSSIRYYRSDSCPQLMYCFNVSFLSGLLLNTAAAPRPRRSCAGISQNDDHHTRVRFHSVILYGHPMITGPLYNNTGKILPIHDIYSRGTAKPRVLSATVSMVPDSRTSVT